MEFFRRWPAHCNTGTYGEQHRCAAPVAVDLGLDPDLIMRAGLGKWDSAMGNCQSRSSLPNEPTPLTKECAYSAVASSASLHPSRSPYHWSFHCRLGTVVSGTEATPLASLRAFPTCLGRPSSRLWKSTPCTPVALFRVASCR